MRNDPFFQPVSGLEMPRFAGMPSFMRLPHLSMDSAEICRVDMGLVGVPWDAGTTNRPGPRHRTTSTSGPVNDDTCDELGHRV